MIFNIKKIFFVSIFFCFLQIYAQTPKRELRGAWVATVVNLDWPSKPGLSVNAQKKELVDLFNKLEKLNFNAVIFQVRPECDAFYKSSFEPWSYWLSGKQGQAPKPFYDPLKFAIEQAHQRGMELHAWLNPFRAVRKVGLYKISKRHISKRHPEWVIKIRDFKFLNPGLPEVRDYVNKVVMDIITRYNVDGIHFDDYFYPYPPGSITTEDYKTFRKYSRRIKNIKDWRRGNINLLISEIYKNIKKKKPFVKFGVSPFGIWKNGIPKGTKGFDAYSRIYADAVDWLNSKTVDYLAPQLYWQFGGKQDFGKLLSWWGAESNGRHIYAGLALYKAAKWKSSELERQIKFIRKQRNSQGSIFFRAKLLFSNIKNITDSLQFNYYRYKAIPPSMDWVENTFPSPPTNFTVNYYSNFKSVFSWENSSTFQNNNVKYITYQFNNKINLSTKVNYSSNIIDISNKNYWNYKKVDSKILKSFYAVSSLNRNNEESYLSNVVESEPIIVYDSTAQTYVEIKMLKDSRLSDWKEFIISIPRSTYTIVKLLNSYGSVVATINRGEMREGNYRFSVSKNNLLPGIYFFEFFNDKNHIIKKIFWLNSIYQN